MQRKALFFSLVLLAAASAASAGTRFRFEVRQLGGQQATASQEMRVAVEGQKLRVETSEEPGIMIYRGDRGEMLLLDTKKKTYMTMDRETIERMTSQLGAAMRQMEQQLENLPPEQRAMMEKMMKKNMPQMQQPAAAPTEVRATGEKTTQQGFPATRYDVYRGGEKLQEVWVTPWSEVKAGGELRVAMESMASFAKSMMESLQKAMPGWMGGMMQAAGNPFQEIEQYEGYPVLVRHFEGGRPVTEWALQEVESASLEPSLFEPPKGYKQQKINMGR